MVFYPPGVPRQVTLMFGGSTQSGGQWGDTWFYDQSISGSDRWNLCDTESTTCTPTTDCTSSITPCARAQHRMTYFDDGTNRMAFLFGGGQPQLLNDTWFWEGSNPPGWVKCVSTNGCSSAPPEARCCVGLAYDSAASEVVLYGGGYDTPPAAYQDTWVWHLTSPVGWNCVAACPNGPGP